jgi:glycine oxidase
MATAVPAGKASTDVLVVGGGVIGLSVAVAAVWNGLTVRVVDAGFAGAASRAAAGLLAPSLGTLPEPASRLFRKAADTYPRFLSAVSKSSGHERLFAGEGILEVSLHPAGADSLNRAHDRAAIPLSPEDVRHSVTDLAPVTAGVLHPNDRWIEPVLLLDALTSALPADVVTRGRVGRIDSTESDVTVVLDSGESIRAGHVVIAAGSWSPLLDGLSVRLPITPAHGEILVIKTAHAVGYAIACEDFYVVPRDDEIVVGATFELAGYDAATTAAGQSTLEDFARRIIPRPLARATARRTWAGLRPMTPDRLPVIDVDPSDRRIVYCCGHGKNGLLLAGLSAEIVMDLIAGNRQEPAFPFRLDRFTVG